MKKIFLLSLAILSFSACADTSVFVVDPELTEGVNTAIQRQEEQENIYQQDLTYDEAIDVYDEQVINGYEARNADENEGMF